MIIIKDIELTNQVTDTLIAIGDVHGLTKWRNVVAAHPDANCYVFLGDYCDPYGDKISDKQVVDNLISIINFKKKYPARVVLLLGNHDMHYLLTDIPKGSRYNQDLSETLHKLFKTNESLFQPAYATNHLLFTHAGVLRGWLEDFGGELDQSIADQINARRDDFILLQCGFLRGGFFEYGGIYWADIDEFTSEELLPGYIQIVGHNRVKVIQTIGESIASTGYVVFCDSLYRNNYLVVIHPEGEEPDFFEDKLDY